MVTTAQVDALYAEFSARVNTNIVDVLLSNMKFIRRGLFVLTAIILAANYVHQGYGYFWQHGAGWFSLVLPAPLDILMVAFMKIAHLHGIPARNRAIARWLMLLPATASATISYLAAGELDMRIVFAALVLCIVLGDYGLGLVVPDFSEMVKAAEQAPAPKTRKLDPAEAQRRADLAAQTRANRLAEEAERAAAEKQARDERNATRKARAAERAAARGEITTTDQAIADAQALIADMATLTAELDFDAELAGVLAGN